MITSNVIPFIEKRLLVVFVKYYTERTYTLMVMLILLRLNSLSVFTLCSFRSVYFHPFPYNCQHIGSATRPLSLTISLASIKGLCWVLNLSTNWYEINLPPHNRFQDTLNCLIMCTI